MCDTILILYSELILLFEKIRNHIREWQGGFNEILEDTSFLLTFDKAYTNVCFTLNHQSYDYMRADV